MGCSPDPVNPSVRRYEIPGGQQGIRQTVSMLGALSVRASQTPEVIRAARQIVAHTPEDDLQAQLSAIGRFVRERVRYTLDPGGLADDPTGGAELLTDPVYLLEDALSPDGAYGDCDDMTGLFAALVMAVGADVRFVTVGQDPDLPDTHIYLEVYDPQAGSWWPYDPIVRQPYGGRFSLRGSLVPGAMRGERSSTLRGGEMYMRHPGLAIGGDRFPTAKTIRIARYRGLGQWEALVSSVIQAGAQYYSAQQQIDAQKDIAKMNADLQKQQLALQAQLAEGNTVSGALSAIDPKVLMIGGAVVLGAFLLMRRK